MFSQKRKELEKRYFELNQKLAQKEVLANPKLLWELTEEQKEIAKMLEVFEQIDRNQELLSATERLIATEKDEELKKTAKEELERLIQEKEHLERELKTSILGKDPYDLDDIVLEIRAGTGGDEAELFAADLFKMYFKFASEQGFQVEIDDSNITPLGGIKELVAEIHGRGAYGLFKYESGVHRVQRIPETEKQGRIHTSTATVAILPLPEKPQVEIKPEDLRIETFHSSGHGGQSVNTTDSAVRITHLPSGLVVNCQEEKSQIKNREKALKVLKARLLNLEYQKTLEARDEQRRLQVKSAKRAEKIRTYNFPQDRLTDHRLDFSFHNLPQFLNGDLLPLIETLKKADMEERLTLLQENENH